MEIHTFDKEMLSFLFGKESVEGGEEVVLPGCTLKYDRTLARKVVHFPRILHFELEVTNDNGPANLAEWIHCRLKKKQVERLLVDSTEVPFEVAPIRKAVEEKM